MEENVFTSAFPNANDRFNQTMVVEEERQLHDEVTDILLQLDQQKRASFLLDSSIKESKECKGEAVGGGLGLDTR